MILTGEDGKQYELVIGDVLDANSPKKYMLIEPLPTPPAKETYRLWMWMDGEESIVDTKLELTKPQAEAVAKAIGALLAYVQTPIENISKHGKPEPSLDYDDPNHIKLADDARKAIQGGSAA